MTWSANRVVRKLAGDPDYLTLTLHGKLAAGDICRRRYRGLNTGVELCEVDEDPLKKIKARCVAAAEEGEPARAHHPRSGPRTAGRRVVCRLTARRLRLPRARDDKIPAVARDPWRVEGALRLARMVGHLWTPIFMQPDGQSRADTGAPAILPDARVAAGRRGC